MASRSRFRLSCSSLVDCDRVTGFEAFDPDQRDLALARFEELNRPT